MINNVVLVGRLTRDPELRTTGSGTSIATLTLAVDRQFTKASGQREADFINCVIWRKAAENFCSFASKGRLVGIQGRIQTRNYDNKDGQRVYVTEVLVDNFSFLDSRNSAQNEYSGQQGGYSQQQGNWQAPQAANFGLQGQSPTPAGQSVDVSSDDLPF